MKQAKIGDRVFKLLSRWCGVGFICFALFFYWTGFDEIVTDQGVWFYGLGISGILFSAGLLSFALSIENKKWHWIISVSFVLFCLSLIMAVFGATRF